MSTSTSHRWAVMLSLVSTVLVAGAAPTQSQTTAASGSAESRPGGNQGYAKPPKPRSLQPADSTKNPFAKPSQAPTPQEALEERLRRGQMDRPTAQSEISDRLEELHRGSGNVSGESGSGQSSQ